MEQAALLEFVVKKCREQRWYGGDKWDTAVYTARGERYDSYYTAEGQKVTIDRDPDDHPRKACFAYPPATDEQLDATERELGFVLPGFLRMLYGQVANGGFGPGYGLHGAVGGFDEAGTLLDGYRFHRDHSRFVSLDPCDMAAERSHITLPETEWPSALLYLCDWGHAMTSCLDASTGCVYRVYPSYRPGRFLTFLREAPSLKTWLECWLTDDMLQSDFPEQYDANADETA